VKAQLDAPAEQPAAGVDFVLPQQQRLAIVGRERSQSARPRYGGADEDGPLLGPRRRGRAEQK
jgi:hypothetical protein